MNNSHNIHNKVSISILWKIKEVIFTKKLRLMGISDNKTYYYLFIYIAYDNYFNFILIIGEYDDDNSIKIWYQCILLILYILLRYYLALCFLILMLDRYGYAIFYKTKESVYYLDMFILTHLPLQYLFVAYLLLILFIFVSYFMLLFIFM